MLFGTSVVPESKNGKSSGIIIGSSIACCRVVSVITFVIELIIIRSFKLWKLGFSKSSFKSPTSIRFLEYSDAFSMLIFKLLKNCEFEVVGL